jgi:alkanesulfonate monooxygenase SsuD/methylene tetrahydromethanopterin reductase-like flavin-dependent oxidoreductase (luciferase family)
MEFGTFYQLPCAAEQSPLQRYEDTLMQIQHADSLGLDVAWLAELHFFPTFSIMPSPLLVASALAQRTHRIRLGIAVNLLPLHHPLRNAEDAATLDILSNGRLEYGAGRGSIPLHFAGYNVALEESRERFLEVLDVMLLAWTTDSFSYEGKYYQYRDVQVVPKPLQKPHPPIRIACNSSDSFQLAGERGWRIFSSSVIVPVPRLQQDITTYNTLLGEHGTPRSGDEVAIMAPIYVASSMARAREHPEASIMHYFRTLRDMYNTPQGQETAHLPRMQELQERLRQMTYDQVLDAIAIFGEPAYCIERLQWFKETFGMNQFICWFNTGGKIPHKQVMESMRLFAEQVMPYVD